MILKPVKTLSWWRLFKLFLLVLTEFMEQSLDFRLRSKNQGMYLALNLWKGHQTFFNSLLWKISISLWPFRKTWHVVSAFDFKGQSPFSLACLSGFWDWNCIEKFLLWLCILKWLNVLLQAAEIKSINKFSWADFKPFMRFSGVEEAEDSTYAVHDLNIFTQLCSQ